MAKKKSLLASPFVPVDEQPYSIPENWCWTYGNVVLEAMESQRPIGDEFDYIDIDAIDNQKQAVNNPKRLPTSKAPSRASRKLHAGDTVFSLVRPYLRNIAYIDDSLAHCIASTGFFVCTPRALLDSRYLYQLMISPYMVDGLNQYMKGDNSPSIRKDDIEHFPFPLPPLPEQKRIVNRLESLFSKLDEAKEKAQTVVDGFDLWKSAILHKAFTGELTERWRKEHGIKLSSWRDYKYIELGTSKLGKMLDKSKNIGKPTKYIRNINVRWFEFDLSDVASMLATDEERIALSIQPEDLFICEGGEPGRCAVWKEQNSDLIFQKALHRFRPNSQVISDFLCYNLYYMNLDGSLEQHFTGSTIKHLTGQSLSKIKILLPCKEEQVEIVGILNNLFKKEAQIFTAAETVLDQIDTMKKAILARAFRGELGTNDPAEEWAGELVKRAL